ncbi:butyrate kinase [Oceanobacillus damuensis]|uniref:butyrate kinase n=1 Tax=Oceanobacillus damuensis TaxID=937928 RepID=UPI0009FD088F|nr:butyrate kinase [Oceanobacillus damuensis]
MQSDFRTLIINPGAESTQIGMFDDVRCIFQKEIFHPAEELEKYNRIADQFQFRKDQILELLEYEGINISRLNAVCGKGGLLLPIEGGTYKVNQSMLYDLKTEQYGKHASNLGGIIAHAIASGLNIDAFIVDPVVVDELENIARYSGIPELPRKSIFHALNHKAAARKAAARLNSSYEEINLIVIHVGKGITIGAHQKGKVIDVNNGLDGDGPFTMERSGSVPIGDLLNLCFSEEYSYEDLFKKVVGNGGAMAYLGSKDIDEIESRIRSGDRQAENVYEAMAYQISKEIGAMSTVLFGDVDGIVFTGYLDEKNLLTEMIMKRINWIADIMIYPGDDELQALNEGVLRVLKNEEDYKSYPVNEE